MIVFISHLFIVPLSQNRFTNQTSRTMKTKTIILAALAIVLAACNQYKPSHLTKEQLVGVWNEEGQNGYIKTLVFTPTGNLIFRTEYDQSLDVQPLGGGYPGADMLYFVQDDKLFISAKPDAEGNVAFSYTTPCRIQNDIIEIDSFATPNIITITSFRLQKEEKIPEASLEANTIKMLDAIFTPSNELPGEFFNHHGVSPLTKEDFQSICPENAQVPDIDYDTQTILFAALKCGCSSVGLYRNNANDLYELVMEKSDNYDGGYVYAYGVYAVSPDKIKKIKALGRLIQ